MGPYRADAGAVQEPCSHLPNDFQLQFIGGNRGSSHRLPTAQPDGGNRRPLLHLRVCLGEPCEQLGTAYAARVCDDAGHEIVIRRTCVAAQQDASEVDGLPRRHAQEDTVHLVSGVVEAVGGAIPGEVRNHVLQQLPHHRHL